MQKRYFRSVILTAFVMAGCAVQPNHPQAGQAPSTPMADVQMDAQGSAVTRNFVIQSAKSEPVEVKGVVASSSSVRDTRWWDVRNVNDGNHHSAWGPADDDKNPTLTLDLGSAKDVSALAIKMDQHPITFDVAIWKDGAWVTVATGMKPSRYQTMDFIDLPNHTTGKVKLTFHGIGETVGQHRPDENSPWMPIGAKLLVCEVKVYSDKEGGQTPTPTPTVMPSTEPERDCTTLIGEAYLGQVLAEPFQPQVVFSFNNVVETSTGVTGQVGISYTTGSSGQVLLVESVKWENDLIIVEGDVRSDANSAVSAGDGVITLRPLSLTAEGAFSAGPIKFELKNSVTGQVITTYPDTEAPLDARVTGTISDCD
jgi:hypothetical protein